MEIREYWFRDRSLFIAWGGGEAEDLGGGVTWLSEELRGDQP